LQEKGQSLREALKDYHDSPMAIAIIDTCFHMIILRPDEQCSARNCLGLVRRLHSFKVFMTYEGLALDRTGNLEVMSVARETGAW